MLLRICRQSAIGYIPRQVIINIEYQVEVIDLRMFASGGSGENLFYGMCHWRDNCVDPEVSFANCTHIFKVME